MNTHRDNVMPLVVDFFKNTGDVKGKKILEIGHGLDTEFRQFFESIGLIYHGTDNYIGTNNNHEKLSGPEYFYDAMEDLETFASDSFDFIFSCHSFEHCEQPITALREMQRVLKSGGKTIIITPWCCKHHIIDADIDHIFVLNQYQMTRLMFYVGFKIFIIEQKNLYWKEQDFNLFTIGEKK